MTTERGVIYRLRVEADPENQAESKKFVDDMKSADQAVTMSGKRRAEEVAQATKRGLAEEVAARRRFTDDNKRANSQELRDREESWRRAERSHRQHLQKLREQASKATDEMREAQSALNDEIVETGSGLIQAAAGFAEIGLASEENTEKLLRGLVRIQGVLDVFEGTVKTFRGIAAAIDAWKAAQTATSAVVVATSKTNATAIAAETAATNALAAARARAALAGAGGAAGGAGGTANRAGSGLLRSLGIGAAGGAGGAGGAAGASALGAGALGLGAAGAGAAAGGGLGVFSLFEFQRDVRRYGFGGGATPGTFSSGVANAIVNYAAEPANRLNAFLGGGRSELGEARARTARFEAARARSQANLAAQQTRHGRAELEAEAANPGRFFGRRSQEGLADFRRSGLTGQTLRQAIIEAQRQTGTDLASTRRTRSGGVGTEAERMALVQEENTLLDRQRQLLQERKQVETDLINKQRDATRERIQAAERDLELTRQKIATEQERLKSGAQRFATLSPLEQSRAIAAVRQARARGGSSLTTDQAQLLQGIGTRDASRFAEQAFQSQAQRAGFNRFFGEGERRTIASARQEERSLNLQLQTDRNVLVQLEQNEARIGRVVQDQLEKILRSRQQIERAEIERAARRAVEQINSENAAARGAAVAGRGGR